MIRLENFVSEYSVTRGIALGHVHSYPQLYTVSLSKDKQSEQWVYRHSEGAQGEQYKALAMRYKDSGYIREFEGFRSTRNPNFFS